MEFEKKEKQSDNLRTRTILFVYEMKDNWLGIAKKKSERKKLSNRRLLVIGHIKTSFLRADWEVSFNQHMLPLF